MKDCPTCGKTCASEKGMKQHHTRSHGESLNMIDISCDNCGKTFTKNKHEVNQVNNSFCSYECESNWRSEKYSGCTHPNAKNKVMLECEYCGYDFDVHQYRADDARFCSQECYGKYKTKTGTTEILCEWCESTFREHNCKVNRGYYHFCSKKCYGKWSSVNKTGQNHPNWTGGANLYEAIRENLSDESWSNIAELNRENSCYKCGERSEMLHEHHIIPVMYGGVNSEELLMTLCPSCHRTVESYTMKILTTSITEVIN